MIRNIARLAIYIVPHIWKTSLSLYMYILFYVSIITLMSLLLFPSDAVLLDEKLIQYLPVSAYMDVKLLLSA